MTDLLIHKAVVAVIDPAVKDIVLAIVSAAVILIPIYFKFKTDALKGKIQEVERAANGMQTALLAAGARANLAEGKQLGRDAQKIEDQATALGREQSIRPVATAGDAANTAKAAEIIAVVDKNVKVMAKGVEVIDHNVEEVHEAVVKEIKTNKK